MAVTRLSLTDFRSYADAVLAPGAGFVILTLTTARDSRMTDSRRRSYSLSTSSAS